MDALLASPRYGERWGRHWLDVARYSDTKGQFDRRREETSFYPYAWTYRDYVIKAFNDDLPYDQFIREQLAADRLDDGQNARKNPATLAALGLPHARRSLQRQLQRHHQRSDRCHVEGVSRADGHLRALPRSQVRSDSHGRLLLALRHLRQLDRAGREADDRAAERRARGLSREAPRYGRAHQDDARSEHQGSVRRLPAAWRRLPSGDDDAGEPTRGLSHEEWRGPGPSAELGEAHPARRSGRVCRSSESGAALVAPAGGAIRAAGPAYPDESVRRGSARRS